VRRFGRGPVDQRELEQQHKQLREERDRAITDRAVAERQARIELTWKRGTLSRQTEASTRMKVYNAEDHTSIARDQLGAVRTR